MADKRSILPAIQQPLHLVIVGHVDHGKSSLIGRLLHDTDSLPEGKLEELKAVSAKRGMPIEWSFVLDAFQAERDQAITIDTTRIWFRTFKRDVVIIDAPGHHEFIKNMISGAANAEAAVLVVDAGEGVQEQTKRHGYLLYLLGIRQVTVAINKMDLVDYDRQRFATVSDEVTEYLGKLGIEPNFIVPISAREGDNIAKPSAKMPWYDGPTVLESLDRLQSASAPVDQPLRFPVQDVYKFDDRRIIAGRIETGVLRVGDTLVFSPSNKTARVRSIEAWNVDPKPVSASAGQSVGITLDQQVFVERGEIASHEFSPPSLSNVFRTTLFWLGRKPLKVGDSLKVKLATREARVRVEALDGVIDTNSLAKGQAETLERNGVGTLVLRSREVLALDEYARSPRTGRCVLIDGYDTVAGGVISLEGYPDQRSVMTVKSTNIYSVEHSVETNSRAQVNGHTGGVLWFTGLSGAGKSTLAMEVEQRLFKRGLQVYVLDGDNVRRGLNKNLGFSPDDRAENIRRIGEVAALFADAGLVCITAFISPYQADRDRARAAAPGLFHEVYVKADLATCEQRDPKGLYKKARSGEIAEFTGISAPYEPPAAPEMVVDTAKSDIAGCVEEIVEYVERTFRAKEG
ncbi:MAG: adenylyl-sulfate kinase [Kiloniellales bacterium]|nr:adenylyl-sulfate kinase [Kiloniellales bacterium]